MAGWTPAGYLGQEKVPVLHGDTPESLHARIQTAEHRLYPKVVAEVWQRVLNEPGNPVEPTP